MKQVAFERKQRAVREAVAIGDQLLRSRRRELLAAAFTAWHIQVRGWHMDAAHIPAMTVRVVWLAPCNARCQHTASA